MSNSRYPAFPQGDDPGTLSEMGLSKREYFAGLALQGLMAAIYQNAATAGALKSAGEKAGMSPCDQMAAMAVEHADGLLRALAKNQEDVCLDLTQ